MFLLIKFYVNNINLDVIRPASHILSPFNAPNGGPKSNKKLARFFLCILLPKEWYEYLHQDVLKWSIYSTKVSKGLSASSKNSSNCSTRVKTNKFKITKVPKNKNEKK